MFTNLCGWKPQKCFCAYDTLCECVWVPALLCFCLSPRSSLNLGTSTWLANCNVVYLIRNPPLWALTWSFSSLHAQHLKQYIWFISSPLSEMIELVEFSGCINEFLQYKIKTFDRLSSAAEQPDPSRPELCWCGTSLFIQHGPTQALLDWDLDQHLKLVAELLKHSGTVSSPWQGALFCWKRPLASGNIISTTLVKSFSEWKRPPK